MEETPTAFAELDNGPSKFEIFLEKNQKLLIASAVAIFLGVLGFVGYSGYNDLLATEAGSALSAAQDDAELQSIITNHGNTASAGAAALLLADSKADTSNADAISALRDFVSTYPTHPAFPTAATNLGLRLLNEGNLDEAKTQLITVLDLENAEYIIPAAQIALGDIAKEEGDKVRAKELYTEVTNLIADSDDSIEAINKYSQYKSIATSRLRFIDAAAPTEIAQTIATPKKDETIAPAGE